MANQALAGEKALVVDWFENDFKTQAMNSTQTEKMDGGLVKYSFSVTNTSGLDYDRFSFKAKIMNSATKEELGSSRIEVKDWDKGEKKTFKSKISIPEGVKSISFVMYAESIDYDKMAGTSYTGAGRTKGADKVLAQGRNRSITQRELDNYRSRQNNKKLDAIRQGKSKGGIWAIVWGVLVLLAVTEAETASQAISYGVLGLGLLVVGIILKLTKANKAKRLRVYEARADRNGNTSLYDLAMAAGRDVNKTADDLQQLIVDGFFPGAYVDTENMLLVMTRNGQAIESVEASAAEVNRSRRKAARESGKLPDSIKDLIIMTDDDDIKDKLKELGMIQSKIEKRIAEKPEMAEQVKDYREKYYPEVVRLTDEYNEKIAALDSYDIKTKANEIQLEEDSLSKQAKEIKKQLIKMIDYVIEASENLLEKLHEDEILDITSDIKAMQTTIAGKGLLDSDFDVKL